MSSYNIKLKRNGLLSAIIHERHLKNGKEKNFLITVVFNYKGNIMGEKLIPNFAAKLQLTNLRTFILGYKKKRKNIKQIVKSVNYSMCYIFLTQCHAI